jgi:hypothetical protein
MSSDRHSESDNFASEYEYVVTKNVHDRIFEQKSSTGRQENRMPIQFEVYVSLL